MIRLSSAADCFCMGLMWLWIPFLSLPMHGTSLAIGAPTSKSVYIGIDVGTQGTKLVAYDPGIHQIVAQSSPPSYSLLPNEDNVHGRAEQDPAHWMHAIRTGLTDLGQQLQATGHSVAGIGVSGQQHGLVVLDANGQVLCPAKLWCDVEATVETDEIQQLAREQLGVDRSFLTPAFTAPKILWLKKNHPDIFQQARWMILPHDYVNFKLGGLNKPVTDPGDASGNGFMDSTSRKNIDALVQLVDPSLLEKLPRIVSTPERVIGVLAPKYKRLLGAHTEIPLSLGSGDNMCAALGVGCVQEGQAVLSLGTSGTLFSVSRTPSTSSSISPFCDATGRYLPLACTMSCTAVLTQVLKEWTPFDNHEQASEAASRVPIGCYGLTFLPYLGGERTPNWPHATGALVGMTSVNLKHAQDPAVLYRTCLEGISFVLRDALQPGTRLQQLLVVGGGAKNALWNQILADLFDCPLEFPSQGDVAAALGAAYQAGSAATSTPIRKYVIQQRQDIKSTRPSVSPIPSNQSAYRLAFNEYRKHSRNLFG